MPTASGLYYAQSDEGSRDQPPIILMHGTGSSHQAWPASIRRLPGQRVIAVDLPGHGRSSGVAQQSITSYANQMIDFVAAMGFYQAVFIGHSLGGAVALELSLRHPGQVAGLGLISTGAYFGVDPFFLEALSNPLTVPSALLSFQQRAFTPKAPAAVVSKCMETIHDTRSSVLYGDWRACADFDLRESVSHIEAPAWVITGGDDQITPLAYGHFLAGRLPAARLQIIPGAGHMVHMEYPEKVAQGLQQFLNALTAARIAAARVQLPTPSSVPTPQKKERF
jgi:pimeloyl-ACP methyl ester carboxylesterase